MTLGVREILKRTAIGLWQVLEFIRWPLPNHAGYRAAIVLLLAVLPFFPLGWITLDIVRWSVAGLLITLALWVCLDRVVSALQIAREGRLAIRAKQLGLRHDLESELKELHSSPWSGLPLLLFIVLVVGCTVVIGASSITYSLTNHFGLAGPFRATSPERLPVFLYFADEAARGLTFRLCDELGIAVPEKLQAVGYLPFTLFMWSYKAAITLLTVQVLWLAITSVLAEIDPEVKRLSDEIRRLRAEKFELRREIMRRDRERIFALQRQHGGQLLGEQREALKEQLDFFRDMYLPEFDEIKEALRRDNRARGLPERGRRGRRRYG